MINPIWYIANGGLHEQVHAGLLQWKSGQYTKVEFSGNAFVDKYREHITFMSHLETKNARAYHTMMHNLYKDALYVSWILRPHRSALICRTTADPSLLPLLRHPRLHLRSLVLQLTLWTLRDSEANP